MIYFTNPPATASTGGLAGQSRESIMASIFEAYRRIEEVIREQDEPFAKFMRDRGFDPDRGCIMVVPKGFFGPVRIPKFVRESLFAKEVILLNPESIGVPVP